MNESKLKEILDKHQLWLNDEDGGRQNQMRARGTVGGCRK